MKRLNLFRSTSDLKTAINLEVLEYPSIINVEDSTSLIETDLKYLSFYALEDAVFSFYPASFGLMYYSLDNGKTWNLGSIVSVKQGLVVSWKGNFLANSDFRIGQFGSSGRFDVMGNIESIIDIDKYNNLQNRILSKEDYYEQVYLMYLQLLEVHETELLAAINCTLENTYEELVRAICIALGIPEEELAKLDTEMYELFVTEYNPQKLTYPEIEESVYLTILQMLLDAPKEEIELIFPNGFEHLSSKDLITTFFTLSGVDISNWTDNMYRSYVFMIYTESESTSALLGFRQLFSESLIVNASNLILSDNTINYSKMFYNCGLLTTPPELPATTLVESCYSSMFSGCKSLKIAPLLPAMLLAPYCYSNMFLECVNLITPPLLPATTLENSCYYEMFSGCASLEVAPELPATTLVESCYSMMFLGCVNLKKAPELLAKTLVYLCYYHMFDGCKALNWVKMLATNSLSSTALSLWLSGTSEYGTMVIHPNSINIFLPNATWKLKPYAEPVICKNLLITADDVVGNATSTIVHYTAVCSILNDAGEIIREEIHNGIAESSKFDLNLSTTSSILRTVSYTYGGITATTDITQLPYLNVLKFTAVDGNVTLTFNNTTPIFYKSTDNEIWESWNGSAITLESNNSIYIKGENTTISSTNTYGYFQSSGEGKLKCEGNVIGLLGDNITEITSEFCFMGLFSRCPNLITSPELPAITLTTSCYLSMFQDCRDLIITPELPSTELVEACYRYMFKDCTSLTTAPELPATTLAPYCYSLMFYGCTSLRNTPELPATTLADHCYLYMFCDCNSITIATDLPATVLAQYCYANMFDNCKSLTKAPKLPATVLEPYCYIEMFNYCVSLEVAPELPATVLTPYCYRSMFYDCVNLITPPELPATTLTESCYSLMFYGCTSLRNTPELPATELATKCYKYMFQNCIGILKMPELPATTLAESCYYGMFRNSSIYYTTTLPATELVEYCYYEMLAQTSITSAPELPATVLTPYCYGSMFKQTKITSAPELPATILATGCYKEMFAGTNLTKAPKLSVTTLADECYSGMFSDCIYLTEMPELPATTLATKCYECMFLNCSSLVKSVKLPATTLSSLCYYGMFKGCTSLVNAPELPATEGCYSCYDNMFSECTSLVNAPSKLLNNSAYQCCRSMFYNCVSLKNAPKLPATSLEERCYLYMFYNCTSLEVAPELPATTLAIYCYAYMFKNCKSLIKAPKLPATQLRLLCYLEMFEGCKSLNYVVMLATTIALQSLYYWLNGTSEKGTVVKHPNTTLETGYSGVPTYWTVENYVES